MVFAFVDIDGVLNTPPTWGSSVDRPLSRLEAPLVKVLDDFCQEVGAQVVISSTWRRLYTLDQLREFLAARGLTATVCGTTPVLNDQRRYEISAWMREAGKGHHFVIFDDDRDADLAGHFVHIAESKGLTRDHTARARALLERDGWRATREAE